MTISITPTACAVTLPARQPHELVCIHGVWWCFIPTQTYPVPKAQLDATCYADAVAEVRQLGLGEDETL